MAEEKETGLFATARRLARAAVTRAIERLTGMPLSGDPWAKPPLLEERRRPATVPPPVAAPAPAPRVAAPPRPIANTDDQPTERIPVTVKVPITEPVAVTAAAAAAAAAAATAAEAEAEAAAAPLPSVIDTETPEPATMLDLEEVPEVYGIDELVVLLRDPSTLFASWEVTPRAWDRARAELGGDGSLTLRLYVDAPGDDGHRYHFEKDHRLDWDHGRRYLEAPAPGALVHGVIGLVAHDGSGRFAPMAAAPGVRLPSARVSPRAADDWMYVEPAGAPGPAAPPSSQAAQAHSPPRPRARGTAREVAVVVGAPISRPRRPLPPAAPGSAAEVASAALYREGGPGGAGPAAPGLGSSRSAVSSPAPSSPKAPFTS